MSIYRSLFGPEHWPGPGERYKNNPISFRRDVLASMFLLEKYELKGLLKGHTGCVNSVLFSQDGQYIFTGSDDTNVNIYLTESASLVESFPSIHTNNIFYARDLPGTNMNTILTCAADGRVVVTNLETKAARRLHRHRGRAHRIALVPYEDNQFYSCGEDGACCLFDLRQGSAAIFQEQGSSLEENVYAPAIKTEFRNNRDRVCSIYTVGVNPLFPYEVAIAGSCNHICLYDSRRFVEPVSYLCPENLAVSSAHVTGIKYDHSGSLLIGSFNDDDVYSFHIKENSLSMRRTSQQSSQNRTYQHDPPGVESVINEMDEADNENSSQCAPPEHFDKGYYQRYSGHRNNNTVKQVSFMGGRSDYVVSGSDCGYLFIWDTHTGKQIQLLNADAVGAINCLSAHPVLPILATSGLESDAKLWSPTGEHSPIVEGTEKALVLRRLVERNAERNSEGSYSSSLLNLLLALMNRGDIPLHSHSSDDEEEYDSEDDNDDEDDDDDDDEEEEEEEDDDDGGDQNDGNADTEECGEEYGGNCSRKSGNDEVEENSGSSASEGEIGPHPLTSETCATELVQVRRPNGLRQRWTRRSTEQKSRFRRGDTSTNDVGVSDDHVTNGDEASAQNVEDSESDDNSSEMDLDDESLSFDGDGVLIDGEFVPFSHLARVLPAILGRRRRSPHDTGDEAKMEDEEERFTAARDAGYEPAGPSAHEASDGACEIGDDCASDKVSGAADEPTSVAESVHDSP